MAYTQADLDAVRAAIVRGEKSVTFADRTTVYRSTEELERAEAKIMSALAAAAGRRKQTLIVSSKGFI